MANYKLNQTGAQIQADLNLLDNNNATTGQVLTANGSGGSSYADIEAIKYKNAQGSNIGGLKFVKCTQAEYSAITTKDNNTLYIVTDN